MPGSQRLLKDLEAAKARYGTEDSAHKLEILRALERGRLDRAAQVHSLHQVLCFLRAFPDNQAVLLQTERMLARFARRTDLRRQRASLADSGIAGTKLFYRYFWATACWLAKNCPNDLSIDWAEFENQDKLAGLLSQLLPQCETPGLDAFSFSPQGWLQRLKGKQETDATFLIKRFEALHADDWGREQQYDQLDIPLCVRPGPKTPTSTHAKYAKAKPAFQRGPLSRARPSMQQEKKRSPLSVRPLPTREGQRLVDMARETMITGSRDLDAFAYADARDVRMVDCGEGLQFACMGVRPERRFLLESLHGFLVLKNGVPVSYGAASTLFRTSEVAYSVFEPYRSAETSLIYARWLGVVHHLLGSDTFVVDPYQLGHDNQDGLKSGAWWFYYKLGYRPVDPGILKIVRGERQRMKADPRHRSSLATLKVLATENMYLFLERPRTDVLGRLDVGPIGLRISAYLAEHYGAQREAGLRSCAGEAARLLGVRASARFNADQRRTWLQWAPLVAILPGLKRWSLANKRKLFQLIRAKGGRRESEFIALFNSHRPLWRALVKLADEV